MQRFHEAHMPTGRWSAPLWALAVLLPVVAGCRPEPDVQTIDSQMPAPLIRVKLGDNAHQAVVTVADKVQIRDANTRRDLKTADELAGAVFTAAAGKLSLDGQALGTSAVVVIPKTSGRIEVGGNRYHGNLRVLASGGNVMMVNCLDLEDYLAAVVGAELYDHWHIECLKAQAVAARSYTLYQMKHASRSRPFDVYADPARSQAYIGLGGRRRQGETSQSRRAVEATRGVCLAWDDGGTERILETVYHSTCGGRTVPYHQYWTSAKPMAPLMGVQCTHCRRSPTYRWTLKLDAEVLRDRLRKTVPRMRTLARIERIAVRPEDATPDGRVRRVTIWTDLGDHWAVDREPFAASFPAAMRFYSDRFAVTLSGGDVVVEGRGHGHGVGMCQYGAQAQAVAGRKAEGILNTYYPGSHLVRVY